MDLEFGKHGAPEFYTDLAVERRRADTEIIGVDYRSYMGESGKWECVTVSSEEGERMLGRPSGIYDTLNTGRMETLNEVKIDDATEDVAAKLCELFEKMKIYPERLLVAGLGNRALTPDSVGPKAAAIVKPTLHISRVDYNMFDALECSEIAVITPGVTAETGMESEDVIKSVVSRLLPDAVIAIDSIATGSPDRLGATVQISNTGIFGGSGVGSRKLGLNEQTLGVPVIAIGVPTVIDARAFAKGFTRAGFLVSPTEIDEITDAAAKIIGGGINQAFGI